VASFWFGGSRLGVSLGPKAWAEVGSFGPVLGGADRCCRGIADECEGFVEVGVVVVAEMAMNHFVIGDQMGLVMGLMKQFLVWLIIRVGLSSGEAFIHSSLLLPFLSRFLPKRGVVFCCRSLCIWFRALRPLSLASSSPFVSSSFELQGMSGLG
jgi:hypothetical protein